MFRPRSTISIAGASAAAVCLCLVLASATSPQSDKLKLEDLIARHLEAIGKPEARAAAKTRLVNGAVKVTLRIGRAGLIEGKAVIASASPKVRYSMGFTAPNYPSEQMAFDGQKVTTSFLPNGNRSQLSQFLEQQSLPLKDGLICGALSSSWAFLRLEQLQPQLQYKGVTKVDGRPLHEVSYRGKKGSQDLKVSVFFEPETFRHVLTTYKFQIAARLGVGPNDSTRIGESYYTITEEFGDFRVVEGLTLPYKYKLQLSAETSRGTTLLDWVLSVERISNNEVLDDKLFKIDRVS